MRNLCIGMLICTLQVNLILAAPEEYEGATQSQILADLMSQETSSVEEPIWQTSIPRQSVDQEKVSSFLQSIIESLFEMFGNQSTSPGTTDSGSTTESGGENPYASGQGMHDEATSAIARTISNDAGAPAENYSNYASGLANTLGQLNPAALARVLGPNAGKLP